MAIPNTSEKSNALDREENLTRGNISAKRVVLYLYDANTDTLTPYDGAGGGTTTSLEQTLAFLLDRLDYGMITDNAKVLQVGIKNGTITTVTTVSTVTTVGSVTSVGNTVRQGDLQMQRVNEAMLDTAFINGITNNLAIT